MVIKEVLYNSALYESSKRFREEVLRLPLGLTLSAQDIEGEDQQVHIAAIEEDNIIVGTVLLKPLSPSHIKLRQMAVSPVLQKSGTGKKLVQFAEIVAKDKNFQIMEMHARISAQGFYEKLGYQTTGKEFIEATVPTIKMIKML